METIEYEADITIGRDYIGIVTVEAQSVTTAAAIALEEVGGAKTQDPAHPLPEVEHGDEEVIGTIVLEARDPQGRAVMREIVE